MERLVKTYIAYYHNHNGKPTWMCHHPNPPHVNVGRTAPELAKTYNYDFENFHIDQNADLFRYGSPFKLASTQVISKSLGITQEHAGVKKVPWERNPTTAKGYKIID